MFSELVYFKDTLEDDATPQYGILLEDGSIICLCCFSVIEEDYIILEKLGTPDVSDILKNVIFLGGKLC